MSTGQDVRIDYTSFTSKRVEIVCNPQRLASKQREALDFFQSAMQNCDKKIEKIMDAHLESVAESAKRLAEYRKRKARQDRIAESARERHELNERVRIDSINHRNMLEDLRIKELIREETLKRDSS